ncbi:14-3-3 protein [Venturia nashicola]|uniref:14-3-3 protein n=1 Tax=Venturia nashicola TaxID=86259 RepID=A0A4Z1PTW3_9PEZI|nr:14-3-3 protein [Venturia nashicola]
MLLGRLPLRRSQLSIHALRPTPPRTPSIQRTRHSSAAAALSPATPEQSYQIRLRPYQEESIQAVLSSLEKGHKRLGLSLATGSGKTVVFTQLIDRVPPRNVTANQTLILAHRQELVDQAYRHCALAYPDKHIEIELGKSHASGAAEITVASMQSITSKDRIQKYDPTAFKLVLVDEAHHIVAPKYLEILEHFGLRNLQDDSPALVGVSATMSRFDGLKLGAALDHIVYHKDYVEMINEKWLTDVMFTTVAIEADLSKVKSRTDGDFQTEALSRVINTPENNEVTFIAWKERAADRKATLVFCVDVNHIHDLTNTFRLHGVESHFVTGETPTKLRSATLDAFKRGEFPVLLNCGVFTEGTDIPSVDCVLLARPTKSRNLLVQMIGRGVRLHPGKENCHVIDMVSSLNLGVVTTPTLFGLDPNELVENASVDDLKARLERKNAEIAEAESLPAPAQGRKFSGSLAFTEYDSVNDLIEDMTGDQHIRAISPFAWVQVSDTRYILTTNSGNHLSIDTTDDYNEPFRVDYTARLPAPLIKKSPFMRPRTIATASSFQDAVHAADKFASEVFNYIFISKTQGWRRGPASPSQLEYLNKIRDKDSQLEADDITKGQAGDMITKLKFGAKGRFKKLDARRQKILKEQRTLEKKLADLELREKVTVGPIGDS